MPRRVSLPNADDLFRPTALPHQSQPHDEPDGHDQSSGERAPGSASGERRRAVAAVPEPVEDNTKGRRSSGRVRHDEKMTVYVTADELLDLDSARLALRRDHGLAVDRGRIVREAIALVLADLEEHGYDSLIVQRLVEE